MRVYDFRLELSAIQLHVTVSAPNSKPRLKDAAELYHRYYLTLYVLFYLSGAFVYFFLINVPKVCPEYRKLKTNLTSFGVV